MAIDFIGFINQNTPNLTAKQKADMLTDFCANFWNDPADKPVGTAAEKAMANQKIAQFVIQCVREVRRRRAQEAAAYEELLL